MAGYYTDNGFLGYNNGKYTYYACRSDYFVEMGCADSTGEFDAYESVLGEEWD